MYKCCFHVTYIGQPYFLFVLQGYSNQYSRWCVCCKWIKWLYVVDYQDLHVSIKYIYWIQTDLSVRLFFTLQYPLHRYWFPTFIFYFASFNRNPGLSWQNIVDFRHCWHFPQMFDWSRNFFLEGLGFSYVRINWRIALPLYFLFFVLYEHNDSCVSCHFVFTFNDRFSTFHHIGVLCSIQFLRDPCTCS